MSGLVATGFGLGLFFAAQVGPVTLLIVRSVLRGRRALLTGFAMAGAVAAIDVLYAAVGLAGIGPLLAGHSIRLVFGLLSAAVLVAIGTRTAWTGLRARVGLELSRETLAPRSAFVTAVAATALNPLTIALWTISFPAAAPGSATHSGVRSVALIAGVALGTLTWYCIFSAAVAITRRWVRARLLRAVDVLSGLGLVGFGGVLGYRAVEQG